MKYQFTKMQALGNDFVVIDGVSETISLTAAHARAMAHRQFGIGCDQVLWVQPDPEPRGEFYLTIFNQDGSEAEQCGNGARCVGRFLYQRGWAKSQSVGLRTCAVAMALRVHDDESVSVSLGAPQFEPARIPFVAEAVAESYVLEVEGAKLEIAALSMGNPHAVMRVDAVAGADVAGLGRALQSHPGFPNRVNAGFMEVVSRQRIRLRVYERGVGETLGCGSGACAAVVVGIRRGWLDRQVTVSLPGGDCSVAWQGEDREVILRGSAQRVFSGEITL